MNKLMKFPKVILTIVMMLCVALPSFAHDFEVGGIYYKYLDITAKTVKVTYKGYNYNSYSNEYTGSVTIPSSVTNSGTTFSVTSIGEGAFYGCTGLTSITIPNSVTSIGYSAFSGCTGLTSITIPNSITTIGDGAFYDNAWYNNLADGVIYINNVLYKYKGSMPNGTSISVKDGTVSISPSAFYRCDGLTSITIPNSVTSIGDYAFYGCDDLTSITIPNSVTSIGNSAFYGTAWYNKLADGVIYINNVLYEYKGSMPNGTSISVKDGTVSISPYAFKDCTGLTSIIIPNSVTSIGSEAFYGCTGLTKLILEDGTESISGLSFPSSPIETLYLGRNTSDTFVKGKTTLKEVTIGNSVTSIGNSAFEGCSGLTSITIPNSVTSIGNYAFEYCSGLTSITIPNSVTSIGNYAFEYCSGLTSITIPNSVTSIGVRAFYNCTGLTSVTIPNSVTSIDNSAFYNCTGLTTVIVENGNSKYDSRGNCNAIVETSTNTLILGCKNSTIPNSVTSIGASAFYNCTGLTSITIPNSVTSIGVRAFRDCTGLTSITIPNSVTSIGDYAFYNCTGLTSVNYNAENCTTMGSYEYPVFRGCSKLKTLNIGNKVKTIPSCAFSSCTGLTSITIPNSVTSIGNYAFGNCTGLTKLILEDGTESISGLSFPSSPIETLYLGRNTSDTFVKGKTTLKEVTIGNSVTSIGNSAFEGCSGLTSITIPNSVTSIGNSAFEGCTGLTSVIIGDSVSSIGASAFYGCSNLIESNNVISPTSVKVDLNTQCSSNLVPCIAIDNKYYTNNTLVESLDPEYNYNYDLGLQFKDNFILIGSSSFLTGELELTTQAAKATSSSSVRLIATTNCDATAGTGFEWLRYDAPAELPPNKVSCPIVDGMLIGSLRGVRDDAYYKYRPFYTSASGKTYYGEWIAFFTGDANVYFEPEVQTYSDYAITDNSVVVKGYALEGTDEITAQGFEYWKTGSTILPSSTENRMTVMASGIKMSATLANLEYNSTYKYRAFVTTAKGSIYGNEVEFETGEDPVGVESILIDKSATEVFEIARYDIHGRLLSEPARGINIIKMSDGTTRKEIVKE